MIQGLRQWMLGIVLTAFAGGLARQIAPKGREQALVRFVCGLLLAVSILRPLLHLDWTDFEIEWETGQTEIQSEKYRTDTQNALSAVIEEKTAAYIWDKAARLGLECSVSVSAAIGETGVPLPDTVTIKTGSYSAVLAAYIAEEVGIPHEKQIWLEEKAWTEKGVNS